jgi:hypothetical protein
MAAASQVPDDSLLVNELIARALVKHADLRTPTSEDAKWQLQRLIQEDLDANRVVFRLVWESGSQAVRPPEKQRASYRPPNHEQPLDAERLVALKSNRP